MIVKPNMPDHWKTLHLRERLGDDRGTVEYLLRLWGHCEASKQWVFENLPSTALKALCRFPGHANLLESSLAASGFLRRDDAGVLTVLNWDEHNAGLIASWENGSKGGRPPKNPRVTHGLPGGNPDVTEEEEKLRLDEMNKKKKKKPPPAFPEIPPEIDTPGFRAAWQTWLDYRRETKGTVTPRAARGQFADIVKYGPEAGIEAIRQSIKNDWTGLFPEKCCGQGHAGTNRQTSQAPTGADHRRAQARADEFGGGEVGPLPVARL